MPPPGYREQFMAQPLPSTAPGLYLVAVGTQRDHLLRVVRTTVGEILDVVHFQDRVSGIGDVLRLTRAARVLAVPFAAQNGTARRLRRSMSTLIRGWPSLGHALRHRVRSHTGGVSSSSGLLITITSPAGTSSSATSASQARISQDRLMVGILKIAIHYRRCRRRGPLPSTGRGCRPVGRPLTGWLLANQRSGASPCAGGTGRGPPRSHRPAWCSAATG